MEEFELIEGCKRNDRLCQAELYRRYSTRMKAACLRYLRSMDEAEDILVEGFLNVFQKIHEYEFKVSFSAWVKRIIVNKAITRYRQFNFKIETMHTESFDDSEFDSNYSDIIDNISAKEIRDMIRALPDGYRVVFNMFAIDGYTHNEIAAALNITSATSRTQYFKAKKMLQKRLKKTEIIIAHAS